MTARPFLTTLVLTACVVFSPGAGFAQDNEDQTPPAVAVGAEEPLIPRGPEVVPEAEHIGLKSLLRTTGADFLAMPKRPSTWVILGIGAGAALLTHPADHGFNDRLTGSKAVSRFFAPGKWIGAVGVQAATGVGLYTIGRYVLPHPKGQPGTNRMAHLGYDLLRAQIVSQTIIQAMKVSVGRERPSGECCAFPSGHAATAFAAASVLERHFGYRAAWPTLLAAAYVGASRLHDNRHFVSDVMFGSAVGIATGWTVVGRHGRNQYSLMPIPVRGGMAVSVTRTGS
jgi:membrane-associated phospholipid phosphatase